MEAGSKQMSDQTLPRVGGYQCVVCEAAGGGYCIASTEIAAHLHKSGNLVLDAGDCSSADEWTWPTRESAIAFIHACARREEASPPQDVIRNATALAKRYAAIIDQQKLEVAELRRKLADLKQQLSTLTRERDEALALVASYDRQDELIGTEFEGVDEVTDVIRLLKAERDEALAKVPQWVEGDGSMLPYETYLCQRGDNTPELLLSNGEHRGAKGYRYLPLSGLLPREASHE